MNEHGTTTEEQDGTSRLAWRMLLLVLAVTVPQLLIIATRDNGGPMLGGIALGSLVGCSCMFLGLWRFGWLPGRVPPGVALKDVPGFSPTRFAGVIGLSVLVGGATGFITILRIG